MDKDLLAKLQKTETVILPSGVVRALDDAARASVVNGFWITSTCSGGRPDMCDD
jgi:hypothetical protein